MNSLFVLKRITLSGDPMVWKLAERNCAKKFLDALNT